MNRVIQIVIGLILVAGIAFSQIDTQYVSPTINAVTTVSSVTSVSNVAAVTSVTNLAAGQVQTDAMAEGYVASQSLTVGTATSAKIGTLTAGTKKIAITVAGDVNYGGVWVDTGTGFATMSVNLSPYYFNVATTTPKLYLIGNAASVAVLIEHIK